jgi:peptide/nickel transport system substrate-binding protein
MAEFTVLGPLGARGPAGEVQFGTGQTVRVVLALLVLRAGRIVSRDELVDALWPEDPPPSARQTVESYVSRLRRALRAAGLDGVTIESAPAGYRLTLDGYMVDRDQFDALAAAGRDARAHGDTDLAAARLAEALSLWRGPALDGLADRSALRADAAALTQARLLTLEAWAEVQLELGHDAEVIAALQGEAGRHPRRERLHELLMLGLYRSGSQAEALEHYAAVRRSLVDELGLEPGPALREMQQRILRQEATLTPERALVAEAGARASPALETPARGAPARNAPGSRRRLAAVAAIAAALLAVTVTATLVTRDGGRAGAAAAFASEPALVTLDPGDAQMRAAAPLPAVAAQITTGLGARWVTAPDDGTLLRLDRDGVVTQTTRVGQGPVGVVTAEGDVWVAAARAGQVVRVDPPSSRVVQRIPAGASPSALAGADGLVWVGDAREPTLRRIDAQTGEVLGMSTLRGHASAVAVGFGAVWVSMPTVGRVARLDPRSGRLRDEISVGSGPGPIAVGPDGIWVANTLDSTVSLIDPGRAAVVFTQQVRGAASAIAALGREVWIAAGDAPVLTRLARDEPGRVFELSAAATALTSDGGAVLAALRPDSTAHRGGTLRVRSSLRIDQRDTHLCCNTPPALRNASYDALLGISVTPGAVGTLVPNLALAVPRPQDSGRTYVFRLRPDLRYWTGRRVRASDFRRGLEVAVRNSDYLAGYLRALAGIGDCARGGRCDLRAAVSADDDAGTVTLHLTRPDPGILWSMALSYFAPAPEGQTPVPGTGPYRIARLVPNALVDLRRNPYFRERAPAAQPDGYADRILWHLGGDPERSVADVIAGRSDYTDDPASRAQLRHLRLSAPGRLRIEPVAGSEYAWLDPTVRPFDDLRVRRALAYAVDRGAVARRWGSGAQPLCQVVPASIPGHVPYCPYTRRPDKAGRWNGPDLAKARALVAASGTAGMAITYWAQTDVTGTFGLVDRYVASVLRRLGYKVTLRAIGQGGPRGAVQIGTGSWWADVPSASQWTQLLSCDSRPHRFCDRTVDRWTRRAARLQSTDAAAANRLWARADRRLTDQVPWVSVLQPAWVSITAANIGGYQYVPTVGVLVHRLWVR